MTCYFVLSTEGRGQTETEAMTALWRKAARFLLIRVSMDNRCPCILSKVLLGLDEHCMYVKENDLRCIPSVIVVWNAGCYFFMVECSICCVWLRLLDCDSCQQWAYISIDGKQGGSKENSQITPPFFLHSQPAYALFWGLWLCHLWTAFFTV